MLLSIPLIVLPVIAYNLIAFFAPVPWSNEVFGVTLISGAYWSFSLGDAIITSGLIMLFFEILKATRTGSASIADHIFSTLLFVVCLIEFITIPEAGTHIFFMLTAICFIDVIAGFSVTITGARRDFGVERHSADYR